MTLTNDVYGAHTQPGGLYHQNSWVAGETLDESNKVVGYIYNSTGRGNAFSRLVTDIYAPIFDESNYLIGYDPNPENKQSAVSGYAIRPDYVAARRSQAPLNSTTADIPVDAAGIFHVDYKYQGVSKAGFTGNANLLDKFNMGDVDLDGEIVKAYVQTVDYPYTVHTPLMPAEASNTMTPLGLITKGQSNNENGQSKY